MSKTTVAAADPIVTQDELDIHQLSDECAYPRKFQINHAVALKEMEYRRLQKEKIIEKLAEIEFSIKMGDNDDLTEDQLREQKTSIDKMKERLAKIYELEDLDDVFELTYEYFKVTSIKNCDKNQNFKVFEVEDGDGETLELDFHAIYSRKPSNMAYPSSICDKFKYNGEILAVGKDKKMQIRRIKHLEHLPYHLVHSQEICTEEGGDGDDNEETDFAEAEIELFQIVDVEASVCEEE